MLHVDRSAFSAPLAMALPQSKDNSKNMYLNKTMLRNDCGMQDRGKEKEGRRAALLRIFYPGIRVLAVPTGRDAGGNGETLLAPCRRRAYGQGPRIHVITKKLSAEYY